MTQHCSAADSGHKAALTGESQRQSMHADHFIQNLEKRANKNGLKFRVGNVITSAFKSSE
jgi:hypothetical protein